MFFLLIFLYLLFPLMLFFLSTCSHSSFAPFLSSPLITSFISCSSFSLMPQHHSSCSSVSSSFSRSSSLLISPFPPILFLFLVYPLPSLIPLPSPSNLSFPFFPYLFPTCINFSVFTVFFCQALSIALTVPLPLLSPFLPLSFTHFLYICHFFLLAL